jgi:hypothetical protein
MQCILKLPRITFGIDGIPGQEGCISLLTPNMLICRYAQAADYKGRREGY